MCFVLYYSIYPNWWHFHCEAVREGRVVWDNLRKVLLINTPINNAQGMCVLVGLALGLPQTPLTSIQVLFSNLITAVTLGFVCAVGKLQLLLRAAACSLNLCC
jgi:magnesium-transporting ATPase (P-type)